MPEVPILMLTAHFGVADEAAKEQGVLGVFAKDNIAPLVTDSNDLEDARTLKCLVGSLGDEAQRPSSAFTNAPLSSARSMISSRHIMDQRQHLTCAI